MPKVGLQGFPVDSDAEFRRLWNPVLEDFGCQVECVENGRMAVEVMAKGNYDLLLMDLHMPQLDGISATKAIRQYNGETPIVALTADAMSSERDAALVAGMNDFLVKPLQQEKLQQVLSRFCTVS